MPYDIAEHKIREKLKILYRALDVSSYRKLVYKLVERSDRKKEDRSDEAWIERLKTWENGSVQAAQDLEFFQLLAGAKDTVGGVSHRVCREHTTATMLVEASVEEFIGYLAQPFQGRVKPVRAVSGDIDFPPPSLALHSRWAQIAQWLDRISAGDGIELKMEMTPACASSMVQDKLKELAGRGLRIKVILAGAGRSARGALERGGRAEDLEDLRRSLSESDRIEVRLSRVQNQPFLAVAGNSALLGLVGEDLHGDTPVIAIEGTDDASALKKLAAGWESRWRHAERENDREEDASALLHFFAASRVPVDARRGAIFVQVSESPPGGGLAWDRGARRVHRDMRLISACEMEGSQALIEEFVEHGLAPPAVLHIDRRSFMYDEQRYPFQIVLGGLLELVSDVVERRCHGWLRFGQHPGYGTVPSLHRDVVDRMLDSSRDVSPLLRRDPVMPDFYQVVPRGSLDCALILRLSNRDAGEPRQVVRWYLAGFTATGTKAAAMFIAGQWRKLLEKHQDRDFLMILEGPADPFLTGKWSPSGIEVTEGQMHGQQRFPWSI